MLNKILIGLLTVSMVVLGGLSISKHNEKENERDSAIVVQQEAEQQMHTDLENSRLFIEQQEQRIQNLQTEVDRLGEQCQAGLDIYDALSPELVPDLPVPDCSVNVL